MKIQVGDVVALQRTFNELGKENIPPHLNGQAATVSLLTTYPVEAFIGIVNGDAIPLPMNAVERVISHSIGKASVE